MSDKSKPPNENDILSFKTRASSRKTRASSRSEPPPIDFSSFKLEAPQRRSMGIHSPLEKETRDKPTVPATGSTSLKLCDFSLSDHSESNTQDTVRIGGSTVECVQYPDEILLTVEDTPAGKVALQILQAQFSNMLTFGAEVLNNTQLRLPLPPGIAQSLASSIKNEVDKELNNFAQAFPTSEDMLEEQKVLNNQHLRQGIQAIGGDLDRIIKRLERENYDITPKEIIEFRNVLAEHWVKHRGASSNTPEAYDQVIIDHMVSRMPAFRQLASTNSFLNAFTASKVTPYATDAVSYLNEHEAHLTVSETQRLHARMREVFIALHSEGTPDGSRLCDSYANAAIAFLSEIRTSFEEQTGGMKAELRNALGQTTERLKAEAHR